ncbi:hypothetical protein COHA_000232 [Chlorella ohadii]|uniref:Uncharacterized protein n=1 Tax=Chlorella ohadii TaxID=2649997 RepID=A0AAD5DZ38_9CHLO|nr:hypothetical protein COHA_000232 [Chlorella ohadii]
MCRQPLGLAGPSGHSLPPPRPLLGGWRPEGLSASCDSSDCVYCAALARLRQPGGSAGCWLRQKRSRSSTDLAGLGEGERPAGTSSCGAEEPCSLARVPSATTLAAVVPDAMADSLWDHALLAEVPSAGGSREQQQGPPQLKRQRRRQEQQQEEPAAGAEAQATSSQPASSSSSSEGGSASEGSSLGGRTSSARSHGSSSAVAAAEAGGLLPAASAWHPSWQAPSVLREVASFLPPAHHHRPRPGSSCCTDIVCALEFEEHGWLLASAGVSKQVRVYSLASRLQHPGDESYLRPLRCHRMPSKLSCLAWNPDAPGTVTVADYDGVLSQVDMESGHLVAEVDEHSGRRVWSVHHSVQRPHLCASASEDGTVRLWGDHALHSCIGVLRPSASGAPACGVRLSPFDANLAAVACADHSAYLYDLRRADRPLLQLAGHSRAVSYVRWLSASSLVTASTDATLALWQLPGPQAAAAAIAPAGIAATAGQLQAAVALSTSGGSSSSAAAAVLSQPFKRFRGHQNQKNFVGLTVRPEDGLLACGSEAPASYTYHTAWSSPLAVHSFGEHPGGSNGGSGGGGSSGSGSGSPSGAAPDDLFCSAVCWQPAMARPAGAPPLLATALSSGEVRVLELQRSVAAAAQRRCMDG